MRIQPFFSTSLLALGLAAVTMGQVTMGQDMERELARDVQLAKTYSNSGYANQHAEEFSPYGTFSQPSNCQEDCQIDWQEFRNGCLWENYCVEKARRLDYSARRAARHADLSCADGSCSDMTCVERRPAAALLQCFPERIRSWRRSMKSRSSRRRREHLANFNLFFDLLGWKQCSCQSPSCCDQGTCSTAPFAEFEFQPQPEPPEPLAGDADNDYPDPAITAPAIPLKSAPIDTGVDDGDRRATSKTRTDNEATIRTAVPDIAEPQTPLPPLIEPPQAEPKQATPVIPRNKLPKAKPTSAQHGTLKVLVAERLSDYIKI